MSNLNPEAKLVWTDYINRVRQALEFLGNDEREEVIGELQNHLEEEVGATLKQASETDVLAVIARLGPPAEIAGEYGNASSPDATPGLPSMTLIVVSMVSLSVSLIFPILALVFIPIATIASRIALSDSTVSNSAYRFGTYPGIAVGYVAISTVVLVWPLALVMPLAATGGFLPQLLSENNISLSPDETAYWLLVWATFLGVTSIWWIALARILRVSQLQFSRVFLPFVRNNPIAPWKHLYTAAALLGAGSLTVVVLTGGLM